MPWLYAPKLSVISCLLRRDRVFDSSTSEVAPNSELLNHLEGQLKLLNHFEGQVKLLNHFEGQVKLLNHYVGLVKLLDHYEGLMELVEPTLT